MNNLAIFDLDHTLITADSDVQWAAYLQKKGLMDESSAQKRNQFYADYEAGCLNMDEFLQFQLAPLAQFSRDELNAMHREFMAQHIADKITPTARGMVKAHIDNQDEVLLISATNEFIITPIAHAFGINNIIGIRLQEDENRRYTGQYIGTPSFREGKITRLHEWLAEQEKNLKDYKKTFFYSDSHNDLPLLNLVHCPVAVNPDSILEAQATQNNWKIIRFNH